MPKIKKDTIKNKGNKIIIPKNALTKSKSLLIIISFLKVR